MVGCGSPIYLRPESNRNCEGDVPDVPESNGSEINVRLAGIEQKLQHVVTRDDLDERLARHPTRAELDERLARFVTREELDERLKRYPTREDTVEMHVETRRHFDVVAEGLRGDIRLIAERQAALVSRMDVMQEDVTVIRERVETHELRLTRLETHTGLGPIAISRPRRARRGTRKSGR
jgi:hypothetical protein